MDPNLSSQYSQNPTHPPLGVIVPPPKNPYAPQAGIPISEPPNLVPTGSKLFSKKIALAFILIIAVIVLPLTVYLAMQKQSIQNKAAVVTTQDAIIAVVAGSNIYKKDLDVIAREFSKAKTIDENVLKIALDIAIERKILDLGKKYMDITISEAEISLKQKEKDLTKIQSYYEILKNKITSAEVKNWEAFVIGFWVPAVDSRAGLTAEEKVIVEAQASNGLKALSVIEKQLATTKDPIEIAQDVVGIYPSLKDIIVVNGYLLKDAKSQESLKLLKEPRTYVYEKSNVDQSFFDTLYSMDTPGQIKKVLTKNQSGGFVIKLVNINANAKFETYDSWLLSKRESFVTIVKDL